MFPDFPFFFLLFWSSIRRLPFSRIPCPLGTLVLWFWVPRASFSTVLFFPRTQFPRVPCLTRSLFPWHHVCRVLYSHCLCSLGSMFHGDLCPHGMVFPESRVQCSHSLWFPDLYVSTLLRFLLSNSSPRLLKFTRSCWNHDHRHDLRNSFTGSSVPLKEPSAHRCPTFLEQLQYIR